MSSYAVVIGVDEYAVKPLTSAVRDALAFRDALVRLGLVSATEATLLTTPAQPGEQAADLRTINAVLKEVYDRGARLDRLFFFFAGHGLTAWKDAARSVAETALVPPDVQDLSAESNLLFNFDNLCARLERAGPPEQFFFVDACRDLVFGERPANLADLGWPASENPSATATAQAVIYAVSPGGQAQGIREGMGIFTSHLIVALQGGGRALAYLDDLGEHVVTAESVADYAQARVLESVDGERQWKHQLMLPELRRTGPALTPIRVVKDPPQPTLTLSFDPQSAAEYTDVRLTSRGDPLEEPAWPPRRQGEAVVLRPQVYGIRVVAKRGIATVWPARIDLREMGTATVHVADKAPEPPSALEAAPGPARVDSTLARRTRGSAAPQYASVRAESIEPGAVVELAGLDPPYRRWEGVERLVEPHVPPGSYAVRFRLGSDVYSEAELDLRAGARVNVAPGSAQSPLLAEAVALHPEAPIIVSETIGPMYTSALLTVLPIVGVLPFDKTGQLFQQFRPLVHELDFASFGGRAVRVVVAVDGTAWPIQPSDVAAGVQCEVVSAEGTLHKVPLEPLVPGQGGFARIAHGSVAAPGRSFLVRLSSQWLGAIEFAAAALPGRITVLGVVANPDGTLDTVQHLLRVPGRPYDEPVPSVPYGRFLRELILGQRLYESDELIERAAVPDAQAGPEIQALRDLLHAKWTDPVLGCMAYYAWKEAQRRGLPKAHGVAESNTHVTARNLLQYFSDLPDARVIAALAKVPGSPGLGEALAPGELPLLARSLREAAPATGSVELQRWAALVPPDNPWTLIWRPDPIATAAGPDVPVSADA